NGPSSMSGDVGLGQGYWSLSPRDELFVALNASRMTSAASLNTPTGLGVTALSDGRARMLSLGANQEWGHQFSERWVGRQSTGISRTETLAGTVDQPIRYLASLGLGLNYSVQRHLLGLQSSATYFWLSSIPLRLETPTFQDAGYISSQGTSLTRRQLILDHYARYRHDLSVEWSCEGRLGVVTALNLESKSYTGPRWGLSALWQREELSGTLSYDRTVNASPLTGAMFLSDSAQLSLSSPLSRAAHLSAVASGGISANQILTIDQRVGSTRTNVWLAQAGFRYVPGEDLPEASLTLSHMEQKNRGNFSTLAPSFARNTIMLTVSGHWPPRTFYAVPASGAQRVDGADRRGTGMGSLGSPSAPSANRSRGSGDKAP
ncbi:MAG TPA: hypothetical protein VKP30_29745, partial [Polyangiaceae bacterium]|nr:hypothetical protein [Polyangiaceae bacterium]